MKGAPRPCTVVLLLSLSILPLLWTSDACMETAWSSGRMDSDQRLQARTIASPQAGSCTCCALCHQDINCASVSFNSATSECELYSTVASYATLRPDSNSEWTYYVMPGRSETGQFCRRDSDCVTDGDFCRGRFCTSLDKVTCRTINDNFGSIRHYSVEPTVYGWIQGEQMVLKCWMTSVGYGYTTILWNERGLRFNGSSLLKHNQQLDTELQGQSLLGLAEYLRQSENDAIYRIVIWTKAEQWDRVLEYEAPRHEPVFSYNPRTDVWMSPSLGPDINWSPSMLWKPTLSSVLLTTNADDGYTSTGAMATADGDIEFDIIQICMNE